MSSPLMRSIGRAAREARRARKLTQEDVADRLGVSAQFYGRIERGHALPSVPTLFRMAEVLDVSADDLLGDDDAGVEDIDQAAAQAYPELDNPRLRRIMRYLRRASPITLRVVRVVLDELTKARALIEERRHGVPGGDPGGAAGED